MDSKALGQFLMQPSTADVLNTPVRRGGILPVTEYPNRSEFDLTSGLTGALWNAITAPARAARGEISEDQQIPEAFNFAGSLTLGSLLAPRPTGSVGMGGRATKEASAVLRGYHGGTTQDWRTGLPYDELNSSIGPWSAFYSSSKDVANKFAAPYSSMNGVYPVDITMKNPRIVDAGGKLAKELQFEPGGKWDISKQDSVDALGFSEMFPWRKEFKDLFSDPAYDGVIIKNTADEGDIYLPTKRGSVKSATSGETLFANAKTGAAVPLATRDLEAQQPLDTRSSNYVVFDDALVEILRKYGLLGPVAGGGTLAGMLMGGQDGETY